MARTTHHAARRDAGPRIPKSSAATRRPRRTATRHDVITAHLAGRI